MAASLLVVMGVCGCGKSSLGQALAKRLGWEFVEGDELHPAANVAKMASGQPLDDADRQDWLRALAARMRQAVQGGRSLVLSCSALKRAYRDLLRRECGAAQALRFIHLHGEQALLAQRMAQRSGHYMPASLLQSQLAILELPQADERALTLDAAVAVQGNLAAICRALDLEPASPSSSHSPPGTHVHGQTLPA